MAVFQLTEFRSALMVQNGQIVQVAVLPEITTQEITLSGSSQQFNALNAETTLVCLHATGVSSWASGSNPTAATTANRRPADFVEYFGTEKGRGLKIAVISNT
jgi:hypothetical protein